MIPPLLHLVWYQGFDRIPPYLAANPGRWGALNPGHEVRLWDEESLSRLVADHYPQYRGAWDGLSTVIKRCDLGRLLVVHRHGGAYLDADLEPRSPLSAFLGSGVRYCHNAARVRSLPRPWSHEPYAWGGRELVLSREHNPIDGHGYGIANGVLLARPGSEIVLDFVDSHCRDLQAPVLDYLGPHALTRYVRRRAPQLRGRLGIAPPWYFLWECPSMDQPPPPWTVSTHLNLHHWGDRSKPDWWNVR